MALPGSVPGRRVVQWATGNIGSRTLRAVIEHPQLTLAGVYAHSPDKAGRDAGELCGRDPVGVLATSDVDEILALGADCVLYTPLACNVDDVYRILSSGANIVTTRGEFHRPDSMDPAVRDRVEAACASGGTSIHSTGSSPGFITEALPLVLSSIQRRLDGLVIDEFADLSQRNSPDLLFGIMGFGQPPTEAEGDARLKGLRDAFGPSLQLVADAVGLPLDSVEVSGDVAITPGPMVIAAGTLPAGTVAAQRVTVSGLRDGKPLLTFRANWYCGTDVEPAWDLRATGWHVTIEGDAPLDIDLRFPFPLDQMAAMSPSYTANRAVNAVQVVCAAPPGIRTSVELPQIVATLG